MPGMEPLLEFNFPEDGDRLRSGARDRPLLALDYVPPFLPLPPIISPFELHSAYSHDSHHLLSTGPSDDAASDRRVIRKKTEEKKVKILSCEPRIHRLIFAHSLLSLISASSEVSSSLLPRSSVTFDLLHVLHVLHVRG